MCTITKAAEDLVKYFELLKEDHLIRLINRILGHIDWKMSDVSHRVSVKIEPSNVEIVSFDSLEILKFSPVFADGAAGKFLAQMEVVDL